MDYKQASKNMNLFKPIKVEPNNTGVYNINFSDLPNKQDYVNSTIDGEFEVTIQIGEIEDTPKDFVFSLNLDLE